MTAAGCAAAAAAAVIAIAAARPRRQGFVQKEAACHRRRGVGREGGYQGRGLFGACLGQRGGQGRRGGEEAAARGRLSAKMVHTAINTYTHNIPCVRELRHGRVAQLC